MELSQAPAFVAAKMALLSDARAAAATRADELSTLIPDLRDRWSGRTARQGDHPERLRIELEQRLDEQKALQRQRPIDMSTLESCKAWLAALPPGTLLDEQVSPEVEDVSLSTVRARIKKMQDSVAALKRVPIPAPDIQDKIKAYVQGLTRPNIGGIAAGESLTVQWPTGLHALLAFVESDVLAEKLLAEIDRIANTPCPLAEREQRIAKLEQEIDRMQRVEEAIVVATGAPRQPGCPAWVILGVKATEAPSVRAA